MAAKNVDKYRELFKQADKNGDGYLTVQELRDLMKQGGSRMSDKEIADTFVFFDGPKGDRRITLEEFSNGLDSIIQFMNEVEKLFNQLDKSGDGFLDRNELKTLLGQTGKSYTDAEVNEILREADTNNDNKISFQEFLAACCHV